MRSSLYWIDYLGTMMEVRVQALTATYASAEARAGSLRCAGFLAACQVSADASTAAHGYGAYFSLSTFDRFHDPDAPLEQGLKTLKRGIQEVERRLIVSL